jgi:aminopeptidase N
VNSRHLCKRAPAITILVTAAAANLLTGGIGAASPVIAKDLTFGDPSVWRSPPSRNYHVENYRLKMHFDQAKGEVFGDEVITLKPLGGAFRRFYLDSVDVKIDSVSLLVPHRRATTLAFEPGSERLWITLDRDYGSQNRLYVRIVYHGVPRFGLFFENPDANYPGRPREIWSQGESEFNHHWFPCWDYPDDMSTSETITTVPEGEVVVSNGRLARVTHSGGTATYDWVESVPHSTYLTSLAIGPWQKVHDSYKGKPVDYYAARGIDEDTIRRAFRLTPEMIDFYSRLFIEYPFEKYAQVAVHGFVFGGQENVSATTVRESLVIQDAQAAEDFPDTELVAHELGQHWFGDYVQGRDWADIWLNEGFATYLPALYMQFREGQDAFRLQMKEYQDVALRQDREDYLRSLVNHHYTDDGMQMLDETTHEKGAAILDMMRYVLDGPVAASGVGRPDSPFFSSLREYLTQHAARSVDTAALLEAIRRTTGQNLDWFFHEWMYMAGTPAYHVTAAYDPTDHSESITVTQTQHGANVPAAFDMPVELTFHGKGNEEARFQARIDQRLQTLKVPVAFEPLWVDFDPEDYVEKTLDFPQPLAALSAAALKDPSTMARLWAASELGKTQGAEVHEAVSVLSQVLSQDRFYGVRSAAAASLGRLRTNEARDALLTGLRQTDRRVRVAAAQGLGQVPRDVGVFAALAQALQNDPSYAVRAAAASSIGTSGLPQVFDVLRDERDRRPERHVASALEAALAATGDARAAQLLLTDAKPGMPIPLRLSALSALATLRGRLESDQLQELTDLLSHTVQDSYLPLRRQAEELVVTFRLVQFEPAIAADASGAPTLWQRTFAETLLDQLRSPQPTSQ